jgi:toxin ParE1/3/4
MGSYFLTHKAVEDLTSIWIYTDERWSEQQADSYYHLLTEACQSIAKNPGIGKNYIEIGQDICGFHVGRHLIFYRQIDSRQIVVVRILHERMDLKNRVRD